MPSVHAPDYAQDFTGNGDGTGSVQVADSTGFYVGCIGYLSRSDANARVVIVALPDSTHAVVRIIPDDNEQQQAVQRYGGHSDLTGWTVAKGSRLSMPAQVAHVEPAFLKPNKVNV